MLYRLLTMNKSCLCLKVLNNESAG